MKKGISEKFIKNLARKNKKKIEILAIKKIIKITEKNLEKIIQIASRNAEFTSHKIIKKEDIPNESI